MSFLIYCDESVSKGEYFSNFYGGVIVRTAESQWVNDHLRELAFEMGVHQEIKWNKVSAGPYLDKYQALISGFFKLVCSGKIRVRIFFRKNSYELIDSGDFKSAQTYTKLYYQFLKHSFGLSECERSPEQKKWPIGIRLDVLPDTKANIKEFRNYLGRLSYPECYIDADDIAEVDSKDHHLLQYLDVVLGAIAFRLNNRHLEKLPGSNRRGNKTKAKEKLYKHIQSEIQKLYSGQFPQFARRQFNIGDSTGLATSNEGWIGPHRHWSFIPYNSEYIHGRSKK